MLQYIDDDFVRGVSVGEPGDTHERRDLANSNVERRPGHVSRNSGQRDEVDYPATTNEPDEANDGTTNNSKC